MNVLHVAADVVREAFARRYMLVLFGSIFLGLVLLAFGLNLEVVDGALAAGRLFGQALENAIVPVDVAMRPVFQALAWVIFYLGLLFGMVVTADIAPKMLSPGRVELLLSLPVRRVELVVGTYVGVVVVATSAATFAVGGLSAVLFVKAEFFTIAPFVGGLAALIAFLAIYGVMLLATAFARSAALAAGSGLAVYIASIVASDRREFLSWFRAGWVRELLAVLTSPLPRLRALADLGAAAAAGENAPWHAAPSLVAGTLAFAAFCVVVACIVVQGKDY